MRHRLDVAKLFFDKDGGYPLRKFKEIYKKEMEENPDKYYLDDREADDYKLSNPYQYYLNDKWKSSDLNYSNYVQRQKMQVSDRLADRYGLAEKKSSLTLREKLIENAI